MRRYLAAAVLGMSLLAAAQAEKPVSEVLELVRSAIQQKSQDKQIARALQRIAVTERLEDAIVEELQSDGAGPQTTAELIRLRDESRQLHKPPVNPLQTPPPPPDDEQTRVWEAARANSLNYVQSLPDFICTQIVRRYTDPRDRDDWKLSDTLLLKLSFFGHKEDYKLISINGHPTNRSYREASGAVSEGEFGSILIQIFSKGSNSTFQWDHWTNLRKRPTHVYFFRIPIWDSTYRIEIGSSYGGSESTNVGLHGYVYVDRDTNMVVRIADDAESIPPKFPVQRASRLIDYDFTDVGGHPYLLPLHADVRLGTGPLSHKNDVEFQDYKKFSADANISFGAPTDDKPDDKTKDLPRKK